MVVVAMTLVKKHRVLTTGVLMAAEILSDVLQTSMQQNVYKYEMLHNMGTAFHCLFELIWTFLQSADFLHSSDLRQTFCFVRKVVLTNFVVCSRNC